MILQSHVSAGNWTSWAATLEKTFNIETQIYDLIKDACFVFTY